MRTPSVDVDESALRFVCICLVTLPLYSTVTSASGLYTLYSTAVASSSWQQAMGNSIVPVCK